MECYADSKDDRVMGDFFVLSNMTQSLCREHCEGKNAMYYATQVMIILIRKEKRRNSGHIFSFSSACGAGAYFCF